MNYEAIILDSDKGHHKRGVGATPLRAATAAFRKIVQAQMPEGQEAEAAQIGEEQTMQCLLMANPDDEFYENLKTLKEDVNDVQILIRLDRTKDVMYVPCGWVRVLI